MKKVSPPKPQRCAIYTRKSTEHNLDLAFNSLDAQREACEAYIKSQAHEGWGTSYPHISMTVGSPALPSIVQPSRASWIRSGQKRMVVYKVDRLTRSLADFAKLVELFDEHEVSFVSVTQSFNTTSSMGRLTLNVLLSFAQFEREVIGERVRDKIAASKRKGIWVGGMVPLGYRAVRKKLEIAPEEADLVRRDIRAVHRARLSRRSCRRAERARRQTEAPPARQRAQQGRGALHNWSARAHAEEPHVYRRGRLSRRGAQRRAPRIVDREVFERVQALLSERSVGRTLKRGNSPHLLTGLFAAIR